ncbi:twin-arginine translocase TatA/TatE family subunit [Halobacteriales archaeon QS_4_69_225]|nr:MAG: twin-arginine translocase TatA/TatE family subunit [Halobacteriales archaeon QS_4_69_225]
MLNTIPLQLGIPGGPELLVILLIAVLLFGANKIPKLARSTGEAMGEFQKGREEVEQELQDMRDGESVDDAGTATGAGNELDADATTGTDEEFISDAETETETEAETGASDS